MSDRSAAASARRTGRARLFMLMSATVATGALAATPVAATPQAPRGARAGVGVAAQFAIAPGSLDVVLAEFARADRTQDRAGDARARR